MLEIFKLFITIQLQVLTFTYVVKELGNKKLNKRCIKNYLIIVLLAILLTIFWKFVLNASRTILVYSTLVIGFKYLFGITFQESITRSFIAIIIGGIFEIICSIFVIYVFKLPYIVIIKYFQLTPIIGILMFAFSYIVIKLFKEKIIKAIDILSKKKILHIMCFMGIVGIALILSKNINNLKNNKEFFINISTAIIFVTILLFLFQEKIKLHKLTSDYDNLTSYLEGTETLLEKYQKYNHENRNQLLVVKGMCKGNIKMIEYIDSIIDDDVEHQNKWIKELKYIPTGGLKGLVSYKINNMIDNNINVSVSITPKLKKLNTEHINSKNYKDICRVIGVFIDNSYEASKESIKKEVNIETFIKDEKIIIIISNTFTGKINIEEIDKPGYTTKGKGRGIGLTLVNETLNNSKILKQKREIIKDYYYQYLYIDLNKKKQF